MGQLIDGKNFGKVYAESLKEKIQWIKDNRNINPGLAVVYIGDDKASSVYVNSIIKKCTQLGIHAERFDFAGDIDTQEALDFMQKLNADEKFHGIICQFPLPKNLDEAAVRQAISPEKDVDSAGSANIGRLYSNLDCFIPCTPKGMHLLLKSLGEDLTGKKAVVVGRSNVVGKPVAQLLLNENMTVSICHSRTKELKAYTLDADVIMAGVGVPHLIKEDMVKEGAIIIDAGINVLEDKLVGDVDYKAMIDKVKYITPVPGGVGPTTILMLIENTLEACSRQCGFEL